MKTILSFLIGLTSLISFAQNEIKGQIIDEQGLPVLGAYVFTAKTKELIFIL